MKFNLHYFIPSNQPVIRPILDYEPFAVNRRKNTRLVLFGLMFLGFAIADGILATICPNGTALGFIGLGFASSTAAIYCIFKSLV